MTRRVPSLMIGLLAYGLVLAGCGGGDPVGAGQAESSATAAPASTTSPSTTSAATTAAPTTQPPVTTATTAPAGAGIEPGPDTCAHVLDVEVSTADDGTYRFDVTVRSDDRGWDKYADAWEVRAPDGTVLGVRELTHPHETEQPFTRSLSGVEVPVDVTEVQVLARDSVLGFCGDPYSIPISG